MTGFFVYLLLFPSNTFAQSLPEVRFSSSSRTIYIGRAYNPAIPSEAAFVGYPSHPDAPKLSITLPQLAQELKRYTSATGALIEQSNGVWLLSAHIIIEQNGRLVASDAALTEWRLNSTPTANPSFVKVMARGGTILISGIKVRSWNTATSSVDTNYSDGRSYITAIRGARMDIYSSEISYLGWKTGEPSGISWRLRATSTNAATGPRGNIEDSDIYQNYYGNYTYQAMDMVFRNNRVHDSVSYGFDPHDYSNNFEVYDNLFYDNGWHGLIFSRGCVNNHVYNNKMYNNGGHGFMLDRGSDHNLIHDNEMYGNTQDGIAVYASSHNLFYNNYVHNNDRYGIRINAKYDPTDRFDGLAVYNELRQNRVEENFDNAITIYDRADRTRIISNTVMDNGGIGLYIRTGGNTIEGNQITLHDEDGILIIGGPPYTYTPGLVPIVPAIDVPGHANVLNRNMVEANQGNGIEIRAGQQNVLGLAGANVVRGNGQSGISLSEGTVDTLLISNSTSSNAAYGIVVDNSDSLRNRLSQNSITANGSKGIHLSSGGNANLPAPLISNENAGVVTGMATPNATIEIYRDAGGEGEIYKGSTVASATGAWSFTLPAGDVPSAGALTAIAIVSNGNTSPFGSMATTLLTAAADDSIDAPQQASDSSATHEAEDTSAAIVDMSEPDDAGDYSETEAALSLPIFDKPDFDKPDFDKPDSNTKRVYLPAVFGK